MVIKTETIMKLFLALAMSHFVLFGTTQAQYLFDGIKVNSMQSESFSQDGKTFKGNGELILDSTASAIQVDIMIQALETGSQLSVDGETLQSLHLTKDKVQRLSFIYRRLDNEQRSLRLSGGESQYFGNGAKFNPDYFEGNSSKTQQARSITLNFSHNVIIHRMRITPLSKFSIKEFFLMSDETEAKFYKHTTELYKNQCFECHGEKMMIPTKASLRPLKRSMASHSQLVKYIKQHRDLKESSVHSLAWHINNKIFKTHHKSLYRTYSTSQWKKLPESLYSIKEFLQKKEAAGQLQYTLNAEQGNLINQGEARFINGALEFWNDPQTWIKWQVELKHPGFVNISIEQAFPDDQLAEYSVNIGAEELKATVVKTENWSDFQKIKLGKIYINEPGTYTITVVPKNKPGVAIMNLRNLKISGLPVFKLTAPELKTVFHYKKNSEIIFASKNSSLNPSHKTSTITSIPDSPSHSVQESTKKTSQLTADQNQETKELISPPRNTAPTKVRKKTEFIYI
jgi:hypothetical protein